jgi:hypothetical protein
MAMIKKLLAKEDDGADAKGGVGECVHQNKHVYIEDPTNKTKKKIK